MASMKIHRLPFARHARRMHEPKHTPEKSMHRQRTETDTDKQESHELA